VTALPELQPGDLVEHSGMRAVYVAQCRHPIWPHLQLVIWRLHDGSWSHDALDACQEVGQVMQATSAERRTQLRQALIPGDLL
jgi:hypothetical protein